MEVGIKMVVEKKRNCLLRGLIIFQLYDRGMHIFELVIDQPGFPEAWS